MATIIKGKNPRKPYTVRYQDQGRQRERSFRTRREASDYLVKFEHDSRASVFVDPRNGSVPFTEYAEDWITGLDRAAGTVASYRGCLRNHIAPVVGSRTLGQVASDRELVAGLLADLRTASATKAGTARSLINGAVTEAVRSGRIGSHRLDGLSVRREATTAATIIPRHARPA